MNNLKKKSEIKKVMGWIQEFNIHVYECIYVWNFKYAFIYLIAKKCLTKLEL